MMIKNIKKQTIITATTVALMTATASVYAADDNATTSNNTSSPTIVPVMENGRLVKAIQQLSNKVESLAMASVKTINEVAYQIDQSLLQALTVNSVQNNVQTKTRTTISADSNLNIKNALEPFATSTLTYSSSSQPRVRAAQETAQQEQRRLQQLKLLPASDTIYSLVQGIESGAYWSGTSAGKPAKLNDDAFNFSAIIEPTLYTKAQEKNSENFIGYATKQYESFADDINLSKLRTALRNYQNKSPDELSKRIVAFRKNEALMSYQTSVRSILTTRSVANNIFNSITVERKPIYTTQKDDQLEAISRAIGVTPTTRQIQDPNDSSKKITVYSYASPMQIADYRANHRLNDPAWYQEVASDSAENLQRKTVILLAEISNQLYQNHLDNEKTQAALAMINVQSSETSAMLLKTQAKELNDAIDALDQDSRQ